MARAQAPLLWVVVAGAVTVAGGQSTESACGTGPSVAATVFAVLLLLALAALGVVMYQYIWKPRHCSSLEKVVLAENGQPEGRFAFDNPYMIEDDDIGSKSTLPCHDILAINEKTGTSRSGDFKTPKKHGFCVITPTSSSQPKGQSPSDDLTANEGDQVTVPLKGHDFTGLGFTVQGGMRDGIFVHTVSQHGPALESGRVQPGDRVTAVTVSFAHITLDDATAILSQSSPYDVQLHLQKAPGGQRKAATPTGTADRRQQSGTDLPEGKSHRGGRSDRSPTTSSPSSASSSGQPERKTVAAPKAGNEPRKETVQHVQRDASAAGSTSEGFREMAVDVPEDISSSHEKKDTEASSSAKARHLGVQVLPPLMPSGSAGSGSTGSGTPGSESGRRSVALGVPSLRLASRDPAEPSLDACLTRLANDQPCGRDLDDETGEPSTPSAEEGDHRRVRMGTSSFNTQERLARREVEDQPDRPEPAKRQRNAGDNTLEREGKEEKPRHQSESSDQSDANIGSNNEGELQASRDASSPEKQTREKESHDDVEFGKLSSEFNTLIQDEKPQTDDSGTKGIHNDSAVEKKDTRSRSSSCSSKTSSGPSSPVQERPKQMSFELPDEMLLAAGVAQDRRSRVDRPARSALFSSTEVLTDQLTTPTEEQPASDSTEVLEDKRETPENERTPPVAMPRTVTPDSPQSEGGKEASEVEHVDVSDRKDELENDKETGKSPVDQAKDEVKVVEEEELTKTVRSVTAYQDETSSPKMKIDKLDAFKEVLSLTPSKSPKDKRIKPDEDVDVVGETVERNHVDRCPCEGPTSTSTAPRITGEVTGLIEVGEKRSPRTEPVIVAATESRRLQASSEERIAPPSAAAVSRARSEAAALPEALRAVRAVRRRDSGGPVAEVLARDAAATSGRLCASTGDLTRSEPPRADSPLGRTVSMQIGVGDQPDGGSRVSAAACARDQMDLTRLGQQEGYAAAQNRHIMSVTSSNESLDTGSIQEEPENEADQLPPPVTTNGINHHGPEDEEEMPAPPAVPIDDTPRKELDVPVNGLDTHEERSRHSSEETEDAKAEERTPPAFPRIVRSELKRNSDSDSSDGREESTVESSSTRTFSVDSITAPSVVSVVLPVIHEPAAEPKTESNSSPSSSAESAELSSTAAPGAADLSAAPSESGAAPESESPESESAPARSRRGPPPNPPPRSPASRQAREPDQFEISATELDSVMISHEEFLRQEAERRAHVCRLAANFRTSREPSPAPE
ncbi:mucin-19-like [Amphibalanus amphitrite]|uniref:mucin-19-like n=1 Tax=Amphibalanus amphitrite TaxID=1232801 RepID=UPI001C8FB486|nr:mucin-19-like [Amphibalanus amphitrite]